MKLITKGENWRISCLSETMILEERPPDLQGPTSLDNITRQAKTGVSEKFWVAREIKDVGGRE